MRLAELIEEFGDRLRKTYGKSILPSHEKAMAAIVACRTSEAGTVIVHCPNCHCDGEHPKSCGHRSCPTCQNHETGVWLNRQLNKLLPVPYFLVTFTIPAELRNIAWRHQRIFFGEMFTASAESLQILAAKERFLGGQIGMTGVLHTHSRRLQFHPHIHFVVPAGAIDQENREWKRKGWHFLVPEKGLARLFRDRLLAALAKRGIEFPAIAENRDWVVNCREVGSGEPALKYLSRYLYRGVVSEKRLRRRKNGLVSYCFRDSATGSWQTITMRGEQILWRILQHVLPRGFRRVRDFGFLHGNACKTLRLIQLLLGAKIPNMQEPERPVFQCPNCGTGMKVVAWRKPVKAGLSPPLANG